MKQTVWFGTSVNNNLTWVSGVWLSLSLYSHHPACQLTFTNTLTFWGELYRMAGWFLWWTLMPAAECHGPILWRKAHLQGSRVEDRGWLWGLGERVKGACSCCSCTPTANPRWERSHDTRWPWTLYSKSGRVTAPGEGWRGKTPSPPLYCPLKSRQ